MSYGEDLLKLRARLGEAVSIGVVDPGSKDTLEAILIQIMNDAEKNRQNCVSQAENLRKQAAMIDGQASAFSSVVSIVYNVINGYIKIAERAKEEDARVEEEKAEKAAAIALEEAAKESFSEVSKESEEFDDSDESNKKSHKKK